MTLTYNADGTTTVTDAFNTARTYGFQTILGVVKTSEVSQSCPSCGGSTSNTTYDASGNVASKTDFNGNVTNYTYDLARNLETSRTEAAGTPEERTTQTQWHAEFRLPLQIDVFDGNNTHLKRTTFTYDTVGRVLTQTEIDIASGESRTTTNSYNGLGLLASVDGPRTDVADLTTYDYDAQGNLITSANALGHETRISAHDAHGRPLALQNLNGLVTQLANDARGRFKSRTVDGQVTLFSYDATGNLRGILLPNGTSLTYTYDAAHRLTAIQDSAGNTITYTLDPLGNRVKEEITDPAGVLTRTHARVYNSLNRLLKDIGGEGQERSYAYDANGNRLSAIDGRGHETTFAFDALNRLLASTDAENGVTEYSYDALDHLTQVKDPKGLETRYTHNALGDLLLLDSPDTATTRYAYDSAGNRVSQLDAKGVKVLYTYDALNRLTDIDYADDALDVGFTYDEGVNGIGRLTTMRDGSGTTSYQYDLRGNMIEMQTTRDGLSHTLGYAYNGADQVMSITYPSGRTVDYPRNALGQVSSVTTTFNGETQTLATNISYSPFGPMTGLTFGNGVPMKRQLDLDYRLAANIHQGVLEQGFSFDAADNITVIANNLDLTRDQSFDYDALDRLTGAQGVYGAQSYAYDAAGNRVSQLTATASETYGYATGSHRLQSITGTRTDSFSYDANGNTVAKDSAGFTYGAHNRLTEASLSGVVQARYTYNGRGERIKKEASGITYYHYDPSGQLLAETDGQGDPLKEYIYLEEMPLALFTVSPQDPAEQILDNSAVGAFTVTGAWQTRRYAQAIGGNYRRRASGTAGNTATWTLPLTRSATYDVYAYWRAQRNNATDATYTVHHNAGTTAVSVKQRLNGNRWDLLGTFTLAPGAKVVLNQAARGSVNADAIRLVRTSDAPAQQAYYYHTDHLGTSQILTDAAQAVVWKADYEPFGELTIATQAITNDLRMPGQYFDAETGFYYNYFRDYDPSIGRYIQADPIGLAGGINTYAYVDGNPLNYVDVDGLEPRGGKERGKAAKPEGSGRPDKRFKFDAKEGRWKFYDKHQGKWIPKPKGFMPPKPPGLIPFFIPDILDEVCRENPWDPACKIWDPQPEPTWQCEADSDDDRS